jgi:hypothetical protein
MLFVRKSYSIAVVHRNSYFRPKRTQPLRTDLRCIVAGEKIEVSGAEVIFKTSPPIVVHQNKNLKKNDPPNTNIIKNIAIQPLKL